MVSGLVGILEAIAEKSLDGYDPILAVGDDPADVQRRTVAYAECHFAITGTALPIHRVLALMEAPDLVASMTEKEQAVDALEDRLDQATWTDTMLKRLALDGLWWSDLLDAERFTAEERAEMANRLLGQPLPH